MCNYAQPFYCCSFIHTILCKFIDWSCFFSRYTMYRHFFWCAFGKISIAAVALLAQCIKTGWRVRTVENTLYDATYDFTALNCVIECYSSFCCVWLRVTLVRISVIFMGDIPPKKRSRIVTLTQHQDYIQTAIENCKNCAWKTSLDVQKVLMYAGVHICSSTMRRRPLEAGRIAKKPLKSSF